MYSSLYVAGAIVLAHLPLVAPRVVASDDEWVRCYADSDPGTDEHKVYFDNCTGGSGKRRGWTVCREHGCIKYATVFGDRLRFCTAMLIWQGAADINPALVWSTHMAHRPTDAEIDAMVDLVRLRNF